jgi:hypothetical protein
MPKTIQGGKNWVARIREWQSLIGTLISGIIGIGIAIGVTSALTAAMKRTDFFLDFTKRYHQIRVDAHDLNNRIKTKPGSEGIDEGDAHQIYFRLFGLMYDEVHAYHDGFLAEDVLVDWMTWQMYDHMNGDFKIGAVSYESGWEWWLTTPGKYHTYTPMLTDIFKCDNRDCVKRAIDSRIRPSLLERIL